VSAQTVITRIAPSPTGYMHIGTARTALFNWLYAKRFGGKFLIRVEDTDRERSTEGAVDAIFEGMSWLGLAADEPPVFQHTRADRHREVVMQMLTRGGAYRCYMTVEELEAERTVARAEGRAVRSPWRDPSEPAPDKPFVVRLKAPREGQTVLHDVVKGDIVFENDQLDDLILLRSDGAPTYNLAVVADDHDMGITHIIRGDDHVSNGARQSLIYQAMGWDLPVFAHIPLIHGPDGAKLSKRHGAQAVGDFAEMGYLPEAMRNYLARLGWGHGDDELFSDEQARAWFDITDVVSSPARLDWDKLNFINRHYIREAGDLRLADLTAPILQGRGVAIDKNRLMHAVGLVKEGASTLVELANLTAFSLTKADDPLDPKTAGLLNDETKARLGRLRDQLAAAGDWTVPALEALIRDFAAAEQVGIGKFGPALRGCLGKGSPAPDLASTLVAFGKDESVARLWFAVG
jgi:glutamyl-tRNA synthetase